MLKNFYAIIPDRDEWLSKKSIIIVELFIIFAL